MLCYACALQIFGHDEALFKGSIQKLAGVYVSRYEVRGLCKTLLYINDNNPKECIEILAGLLGSASLKQETVEIYELLVNECGYELMLLASTCIHLKDCKKINPEICDIILKVLEKRRGCPVPFETLDCISNHYLSCYDQLDSAPLNGFIKHAIEMISDDLFTNGSLWDPSKKMASPLFRLCALKFAKDFPEELLVRHYTICHPVLRLYILDDLITKGLVKPAEIERFIALHKQSIRRITKNFTENIPFIQAIVCCIVNKEISSKIENWLNCSIMEITREIA